ncbi:MAG TPA: hypothetical protein VJG13_00675 [Thermoanaerobaculia bacterium]|jgi:hypothetical protein|nr:hypothetical protein [Thermoanaerobaculia bacterium]
MTPKETRGEELAAILRRRAPYFEALFRRCGVSPDEARSVLDQAGLEVELRCHRITDMEGRLMRSVERRCAAILEERRRRALEALGPAIDPAEAIDSDGSGETGLDDAEPKGET